MPSKISSSKVKFGTSVLNKVCTLSCNAMRLEFWTKRVF